MELYDDPPPSVPVKERDHGRLYWFFWHVAEWFTQQHLAPSDVSEARSKAEAVDWNNLVSAPSWGSVGGVRPEARPSGLPSSSSALSDHIDEAPQPRMLRS